MFVKVELTVVFRQISYAENYREESQYTTNIEEKNRLLKIADQLDEEDIPTVNEIYDYLNEKDPNNECNPPRYVEMIDVCSSFIKTYNHHIYMTNDNVIIYFEMNTTETIDMLYSLLDTPFEKSWSGGHVGNYCKFPSRNNINDQLGQLDVKAKITEV